jgi:membrane-bound ClpP family serine protease
MLCFQGKLNMVKKMRLKFSQFNKIHSDRAKMEWDKVYFASIRKAVLVAILLRLGFTSVIFTLIIKKLFRLSK